MARNRMLVLLPVLLLTIAVGCGVRGPAFSPLTEVPEGKALVYIYRIGSLGGAVTYTVHTGDEEVVDLQTGGYFPYLANPGEREFWARTEAKTTASENLRAGQTYYLKGGIGVGFFIGHPKLQFVDRAVGEAEITNCNLIEKE